MKKRILAMTMAGVMTMGMLAGCGSSSDSSSEAASSGAASEAASSSAAETSSDDVYNISFIVKHTDAHFKKVMAGAQAYQDEHGNVEINFVSPTAQSMYDEQINMIETALSTDAVDAVAIAPLMSDTAATLVADTDKPIVAFDTDFESDKKSSFIGTGNETAAYEGGKATVEAAVAKGIETPTVVILTGIQGDETHEARMNGYIRGAEEAGGEVIEIQYTDATADKSAVAMEGVMQKYQDGVDCVLAIGDEIALAAVKVIEDTGMESYNDTMVCGFDGTRSALESVQSGGLYMTVAQEGYQMGYLTIQALVDVLEGKEIDSYIDSGATLVNGDNVEEYIQTMKDINVWDE
ncbi:MAG: sugar ABC transporter substrate-binding protein [Lachnospiraceae bacterium]|nr:sugar ABC transporter substrate-binding protein [Lachnospiraceae bacterium]